MEYVDILSMVADSDHNTTKDFMPLINDIPTDFFPDSSLLSQTAIINGTRNGMFVAVGKEDDIVILKFFTDGKQTLKSCTKKVQIEFVPGLEEKLALLHCNKPTSNIGKDFKYQQLCMVATVYVRHATFNDKHAPFKAKYGVCYYLRKDNNNKFFLQSEIRVKNPKTYNNVQMNELSIFNKIQPTFQNMLSRNNVSSDFEDFEEFDNIEELKDVYNFDDVEYDEDDLLELADENEYQDNDSQNDNLLF